MTGSQDTSIDIETNRRDFLKESAAASVGAAMAGSQLLPQHVHASHDDTIKVALVGCGNRGAGAAVQALSTEGPVKLWAMADAFSDRLEASLKAMQQGASVSHGSAKGLQDRIDVPEERRFVGLDAYQQAIDSGVDVVILAEPPGFRPQHFEYAVSAGKHVFMEKPVATDAHGVRRVIKAAEEAKAKNLKVGVGLQRHHSSNYREAVRRLHDGEIGDITNLRCYWEGGFPAKTPFQQEGLTELEHQVRNWYFFAWLSGDHICEQHIHNLDVCNWIKRAHPVEAHGSGGRQVRVGKEYGNIFDHHYVEYTYADGSTMISHCRQTPNCRRHVGEAATGTKGRVTLQNDSARFELFDGAKSSIRRRRGETKASPYQVEHDVLFAAIRNDTPHNEAEYGAHSTMTAILGRLATYSGKTVTWDEAFNSNLRLAIDAHSWNETPRDLPNEQGAYEIPIPGLTKVV